VAAFLALSSSAQAHNAYVDGEAGADSGNDCSQKASPCRTIVRGLGQAGAGDKVFVQPGHIYTASIVLQDRKSLIAKDFAGTGGVAVLDNGNAGDPDILNPSVAPVGHVAEAGKVKGFFIASESLPVEINAGMTLAHNEIADADPLEANVSVGAAADATISHNVINDPTPASNDPSDQQTAIAVPSTGTVEIVGNTITHFWNGIEASGAGAHLTIERNTVTGTHEVDNYAGNAILAREGVAKAQITDNLVADPDLALDNGIVDGIVLLTNGSIDGNFVGKGFGQGIAVNNASKPVSMKGDVVLTAADDYGLNVIDDTHDDAADAKIVNTTVWGAGIPLEIAKVKVTFDSSILGNKQKVETFYGSNHCSISHSRGPVKSSGNSGCNDFQTKSNPKFKSDGYHLKGSSPMIDRGNPDSPGKHAKDIDGDKRALAGNCGHKHAKKRRDIGADEFKCK
jgi:hypothetical protein